MRREGSEAVPSRDRPAKHAVAGAIACLILGLAAWPLHARTLPEDPLRSPLWTAMAERFLDGGAIVFDDRVKVFVPGSAEDALNVPVTVDARAVADVVEILVFADLNPIPKIIEFEPLRADAALSLRFKVEQSTPVRAAVRTKDGAWRVGGAWLSAAGGGCTTPSIASGAKAWQERFGEVSARLWPKPAGISRMRVRIVHPMDTGLAARIPVFHIDRVSLRDGEGTELGRLHLWEPISENPVISIDLHHHGTVAIEARDIQGNAFSASVRP